MCINNALKKISNQCDAESYLFRTDTVKAQWSPLKLLSRIQREKVCFLLVHRLFLFVSHWDHTAQPNNILKYFNTTLAFFNSISLSSIWCLIFCITDKLHKKSICRRLQV